MAELTVPRIDFSPLGDLYSSYTDARDKAANRMSLASLGQDIQNGTVDYTKAAGRALQSGNSTLGLSLLQLGETQKKQTRELEASQQFQGLFKPQAAPVAQADPNRVYSADELNPIDQQFAQSQGNQPRGIRNNNPLNIEAGSFTQGLPGFKGSDGRFAQFETAEQGMAAADRLLATYGQKGINTVAGVIGRWAPANDGNPVSAYADFVARKAGIDPNTPINLADPAVRAKILPAMAEFENGRPVQTASADALPPNAIPTQGVMPQAAPQRGGLDAISPEQLIAAVSHPNLPAGQKEVAKMLLAEKLKVNPEIQKLEAFRRDPQLMQMAIDLRKAGATNVTVDQKGEGEFEKEFGKDQAKRFSKMIENGDAGERKLVDINNMRAISQRMGSQGAAADLKEWIGPAAEALGINISGLSDIQAYGSIIQRLAPQQRAPGSGSTSDIEFKGFLKSLPVLSQNPVAREITLNTMEAFARDDIARGEIASRLGTKEINRAQAEKELRALADPMKGFTEWRKANPDAYAAALKGSAAGQLPPQGGEARTPPQRSAPQGAPQGTRQAPDGKFYAPDPARPGKWLQVE